MNTEVMNVVEFDSKFDKIPNQKDTSRELLNEFDTPAKGARIMVVDDQLSWLHIAALF